MELNDFKYIFFWEWFHRFWGRLIGLVYAFPLAFFWFKGWIPSHFKTKLLGLLALGGAQAVMGWYMVESGLIDIPSVSHYRLAMHLGLAFIIFIALVWVGYQIRLYDKTPVSERKRSLKIHYWACWAMLGITIIWGAFVAGLDAGLVYNTWPLMGKNLIPTETFTAHSIFTDPVWVQFFHRWIAIVSSMIIVAFAWRTQDALIALAM